jgi:hypothetical protein
MATAAQLQREFYGIVSDPMFGEDIVYISGGIEYAIKAKVYRKGINPTLSRFDLGSATKYQKYDYEIRISTHATQGIPTISIKNDSAKISKDIGGAIHTMRVMEIIDQDPGTWRLGLSV